MMKSKVVPHQFDIDLSQSQKSRNIVMVIEYDGTNYAGWQSQPDRRSIQSAITQALSLIFNQPITIHASGRTDAGVHALGQVANCKVISNLSIPIIFRALNSSLPSDMRIVHLQEAHLSFDARKDAIGKEYHYWMYCGSRFPVFLRHYVFYPGNYQIDWPLLEECVSLFVGNHDFTGFSASGSSTKHMVRQIRQFTVQDYGDGFISFRIVGNGFLYKMVRLLLGEIWMVQMGKKSINYLRLALTQPNREKNRLCLPPHGLYLARVYYPEFDPYNGIQMSEFPSPFFS